MNIPPTYVLVVMLDNNFSYTPLPGGLMFGFLAVPWVCLLFVIVVFPDHTHYFWNA